MNYIIYNGKIKAITHIINFSYAEKDDDGLTEKNITGRKYVLNGQDYNEVLKKIEREILKDKNENAEISVEDVDCSDVINYDGMEAATEEEAETIIKNLTLEEQLLEAQFELDSLRLGLEG